MFSISSLENFICMQKSVYLIKSVKNDNNWIKYKDNFSFVKITLSIFITFYQIYSLYKIFLLFFLFMLTDFSWKFSMFDVSHLIVTPSLSDVSRPPPPSYTLYFLHCTCITFTRENTIYYDRTSTNHQEYNNHTAFCTALPTIIARDAHFTTSYNVKKSTIRLTHATDIWMYQQRIFNKSSNAKFAIISKYATRNDLLNKIKYQVKYEINYETLGVDFVSYLRCSVNER